MFTKNQKNNHRPSHASKIISILAVTTSILTLTACHNTNSKTALENFTGGVNAPNAYETYKNTGLKVPSTNSKILKPNIKSNYLLQLNDIQQKVVKAILLDQSKDIQEQIEPAKIVYLNSDNLNPNPQDNTLINENSTKEEEILFDDLTLFSNKATKKTTTTPSKIQLDPNHFTSTASIRDTVNHGEITNKNFVNSFKNYILYDQTTKDYTQDLLNLHITTNNAKRLKFFRLLDQESQPKNNRNKKYFLYSIGMLSTTPIEYILDVKAEKERLKKLSANNQKITGDQAPMYKIGNANTTLIGGYLNKVGINTASESELHKRNQIKHHHNFNYKK